MWFIVFPTRPSPRKQAFAGMSAGFFTELRMGCVCARGQRPKELRRLAWTGGLSTMFVWMGTGTQWLILSATEMSEHKTDRKSTRLNSSHVAISYAVFCL